MKEWTGELKENAKKMFTSSALKDEYEPLMIMIARPKGWAFIIFVSLNHNNFCNMFFFTEREKQQNMKGGDKNDKPDRKRYEAYA
jgi:hypothetical protein